MAKGSKDITLIVSPTTRQVSQDREERKKEATRGPRGTWEIRSQSVFNTKITTDN